MLATRVASIRDPAPLNAVLTGRMAPNANTRAAHLLAARVAHGDLRRRLGNAQYCAATAAVLGLVAALGMVGTNTDKTKSATFIAGAALLAVSAAALLATCAGGLAVSLYVGLDPPSAGWLNVAGPPRFYHIVRYTPPPPPSRRSPEPPREPEPSREPSREPEPSRELTRELPRERPSAGYSVSALFEADEWFADRRRRDAEWRDAVPRSARSAPTAGPASLGDIGALIRRLLPASAAFAVERRANPEHAAWWGETCGPHDVTNWAGEHPPLSVVETYPRA